MKKVGLRSALQKLGCTDITLRWNGGPACRDQSGFFVGGGEHGLAKGQLYYVTYSPQSVAGLPCVMHRTAAHRKDWTGGQNQWWLCNELAKIGLAMDGKTH